MKTIYIFLDCFNDIFFSSILISIFFLTYFFITSILFFSSRNQDSRQKFWFSRVKFWTFVKILTPQKKECICYPTEIELINIFLNNNQYFLKHTIELFTNKYFWFFYGDQYQFHEFYKKKNHGHIFWFFSPVYLLFSLDKTNHWSNRDGFWLLQESAMEKLSISRITTNIVCRRF